MTEKRVRRDYSAEEKATALATLKMNGGNVKRTSREMNIHPSTMRHWAKGEGISGVSAPTVQAARGKMADELETITWKFIDHIATDRVIAAMNGQQATVAIGILIDKMRLLRDLPTEIVSVVVDIDRLAKQKGIKASDLFNAMLTELNSESDAPASGNVSR